MQPAGLVPWINAIGVPLPGACMGASSVAIVPRFRRARGAERLQTKWLALSSLSVGLTCDGARTIERFSARPRGEIDLDALAGELLGVVRGTMQPSLVSLWLRTLQADDPSSRPASSDRSGG